MLGNGEHGREQYRVRWQGFVELLLILGLLGAYGFGTRAALRWA